jgi:hypothetical protein
MVIHAAAFVDATLPVGWKGQQVRHRNRVAEDDHAPRGDCESHGEYRRRIRSGAGSARGNQKAPADIDETRADLRLNEADLAKAEATGSILELIGSEP